MGVLWGVDHFKPYLSGRRFKLIVDCSALTWLFRSRDLCPKLHRWSLRLMEYDMDLVWKEGAQHVLPDALSRLPHAPYPQGDVDDSFPDDPSSSSPSAFVGPRGPVLDGTRLADIDPDVEPTVAVASEGKVQPLATPPAANLLALQALPFADVATLEATAAHPRRGTRPRTRNVRLRAPGDVPLPPTNAFRRAPKAKPPPVDPVAPVPVATRVDTPASSTPPVDDLGEVLYAGGEVPSPSPHNQETPAVDRAILTLASSGLLAQRQREDDYLCQVRSRLEGTGTVDPGGIDCSYSLDNDDVIRHQACLR